MMIIISAFAMPMLFLLRQEAFFFFVLVAVVYWCYGTQLSVFASTTADFYGTKNLGLNYGVLFSAWGAAGVLGPAIAGRTFVAYKDYSIAFYTAGVLALVAFASLSMAKAPTKSSQTVAA